MIDFAISYQIPTLHKAWNLIQNYIINSKTTIQNLSHGLTITKYIRIFSSELFNLNNNQIIKHEIIYFSYQ